MTRRRRSRSEWTRIVTRWRASRLSATEFARRHDLTARQLQWWSWRLGKASSERGEAQPDPITLIELAPSARADERLELVLINGRTLRFSASVEAAQLCAIIAAAESRP